MSMRQIERDYHLRDDVPPLPAREVKSGSAPHKEAPDEIGEYYYNSHLHLDKKSIFTDEARAFLFGDKEQEAWRGATYQTNASHGFLLNSYVYAIINKVQTTVARIPLRLYETTKDEKGEEKEDEITDKNNPVLALLRRPNPRQRRGALIKEFIGSAFMAGEWFAHINRISTGEIVELTPLRPDWMTHHLDAENSEIVAWEYKPPGARVRWFKPEEIIHHARYNPLDPWRGISPIAAARIVIDAMNAAKQWNLAMFKNSARPSGAWKFDGQLNDDQYRRMQRLMKKHTGPTHAGTPLIVEGGGDFVNTQLNARDLDFLESLNMGARELSIILGVPSELLNDSTNKTYSNERVAYKIYYTDTILPLLDELVEELNEHIVYPLNPQWELRYDITDVEALQEDQNAAVERAVKKLAGGLASQNELRPEFGLSSDLEGGDKLYLPGILGEVGSTVEEEALSEEQRQKEAFEKTKSVNVEDYV